MNLKGYQERQHYMYSVQKGRKSASCFFIAIEVADKFPSN